PGVGLGALRNAAVAAAGGEVLAFVDADHEIGAEWIDAALETFANPKGGAVGAAGRPPTPGTWVQRTYDRLRRHGAGQREVDWLGPGNMAVRRKAFEVAGG